MKDKTEPGETPAIIEAGPDGIEIGFEGYGTKCMEGTSPVIYIERYQNRIRLYCWNDLSREDPLVIDFEGAKLPEAA